jgi:SAM-dependent methyltransferase
MLAPIQLPENFAAWNRQYGAPAGYERPRRTLFRSLYSDEAWLKLGGPFAIQPGNNSTRRFEYPWTFHAADLSQPRTIVELGGSLAGPQFVLAQQGHRVLNVDPGLEAGGLGWLVDQANINRLNGWFGTDVRLINTTLDRAGLADDSVDLIFSISVLEHLTARELTLVMQHAGRCLRPGGRFVITLDLFLNLAPFTERLNNEYGTNQDVRRMIAESGLDLLVGDRAELNGFAAFDPQLILSRLEQYLIGSYPVLTQCIVLEKPAA